MIIDNKELARCSKRDFIPETEEEMVYKVYKFAMKKVAEYNEICMEKYRCSKYDELESAAFYAISKSIKTFKNNKDTLYITYASRCIINELSLYIRKESRKVFKEVSIDAAVDVDKDSKPIGIVDMLEDKNAQIDKKLLKEEKRREKDERLNTLFKVLYYTQPIKYQRAIMYTLMDLSQAKIAENVGISQASISRLITTKIRRMYNVKLLKKQENVEFEMYLNNKNAELYLSDRLVSCMKEKLKDAKYIGKVEGLNKYQIKKTKEIYDTCQEFLIKVEELNS